MNAVKRKRKHKPGWYVIAALLAVIVLYFLSNTGRNIADIVKFELLLRREKKTLEKATERLDSLRIQRERLLNDSTYIGEIARREYGMKKKDEEIFYITNPDSGEAGVKNGNKN